jgi:PAS domain S-box-containing protein
LILLFSESQRFVASEETTMIAPSRFLPQAQLEQTIADLQLLDDWNAQVLAETEIGLLDWPLGSQSFYLSPIFKQMLGYADDELPNTLQSWLDHVHADDYQRVTEVLNQAVRGDVRRVQIVHRANHRNGSTPLFLVNASIVRNSRGTPTRLLAAVVDLTGVSATLPALADC